MKLLLAISIALIYSLPGAYAAELVQDQPTEELRLEVDRLAKEGYEARTHGNITGAIALFKEALAKNRPFAKMTTPPKCMGHQSAQYFLASSLASTYSYEGLYEHAEEVMDTYRDIFTDGKGYAEVLMKQHKYAEARAILRTYVPEMQEPRGATCGNPMANYMDLKRMMRECETATPNLTEKDMHAIDLAREKRRALLQRN